MARVKVDSNGVPYWDQLIGTHWDYSVDYQAYVSSIDDTLVSAVWSVQTSGLAITSTTYTASGIHMGWVSPSAANVGSSYVLVSKVFTNGGRIERTKIKVNVGD